MNEAYDLVFARLGLPNPEGQVTDDLNLEFLFDDPLVIVAGLHSRWSRRRNIDLAELKDEPWLLAHTSTWNYIGVAEAFRERGLDMPNVSLLGFSLHLVNHFVANGPFLTAYPRSVARVSSLRELPVKLPVRPWPVAIATLKNRTVSPVVERFIECSRDLAKSMAKPPKVARLVSR